MCTLITYLGGLLSHCMFVFDFMLLYGFECNYHYFLGQKRSELSMEEWSEGAPDKQISPRSSMWGRNDHLNEVMPAGGILQGKRSKQQECTATEEKGEKEQLFTEHVNMW